MIPELLARIRFLILRKKRSEFDEEMRFHLDQSIAAKIAQGMPAAEARRQALIELGAVEAGRPGSGLCGDEGAPSGPGGRR